MVSKKSLTKSTKITGTSAHVSASSRLFGFSASPMVEKSEAFGKRATASGQSRIPKIRPSTVETMIPIRIAPLKPRAVRTIITSRPASAISGGPAVRTPRPIPVASLLIVIPASRNPTSAMNRPMPTPIESLISCGTARMIASRRPASTRISATTPSITTHAIATGQGRCAAEDQIEGDDGVEAEARRERERQVRRHAHDRREQRRAERRGHRHRGDRHARPRRGSPG